MSKNKGKDKYTTQSLEWWNDRRIEAARLLLAGNKPFDLYKMVNEDGKRKFPGNAELTIVTEAVRRGETPLHNFYKPKTETEATLQPSGQDTQGSLLVGQVRPRVVQLSERLFILYDLAKIVFPEYEATEGEWIFECIMQFYEEHSEELELSRLFPGLAQVRTTEEKGLSHLEPRREGYEIRGVPAEEAVSPV